MSVHSPLLSSESPEHYTPAEIVEAARATMRTISLDPASCRRANDLLVRASKIYTKRDNGFVQPWSGRVFLNPPGGVCDDSGVAVARIDGRTGYYYSDGTRYMNRPQSAICAWWYKLLEEHEAGHVEEAIFVGFSLELISRTQASGSILMRSDALCFPSKRIKFMAPLGASGVTEGKIPTHSNVIAYLGPNVRSFCTHFAKLGDVGTFNPSP